MCISGLYVVLKFYFQKSKSFKMCAVNRGQDGFGEWSNYEILNWVKILVS